MEQGKLFLNIENLWGDFDVFISKKKKFPNKGNSAIQLNYLSNKAGLYEQLKTTEIDP